MKTRAKSTSTKNIDLIVSKMQGIIILDITEMMYVRGGDGEPIPPPPPVDFPKI